MVYHYLRRNARETEVACTNRDGDPVSAKQRLCALWAANSVLRSQQALLVLGEIEDIFNTADTADTAGQRAC
jgi:transitional endoplasmic reticulum ATPase